VAGISSDPHRINDRASQQRGLLRILTAFPIKLNENISLLHHYRTKIDYFLFAGTGQYYPDMNNYQ